MSRSGSLSRNRFETYLTISQPIFSGFRDFYIADAARAEIRALELGAARRLELLYLDVADVYSQVVLYDQELGVLAATKNVLGRRIRELRDWLSLGKSREGELSAAQSEVADLDATLAQTLGLREASMEMLRFLTGIDRFSVSAKVAVAQSLPVEWYLERAAERVE